MRERNLSKRTITRIVGASLLVLLIIFFGPYYFFLTRELQISPLQTLFLSGGVRKVNDQVTILILGVPGGKHDGPLLSDSIIVANYNFKKNKILTLGIPRDVWSQTLQDRINSAYAYGETKRKGGGLVLAKAEVGAIVGIPIQYVAVMNFSEFKELIDFFGGVDIEVQRSFIDRKFPVEGKENADCGKDPEYRCRYQTVRFAKGKQHMDGETALKFVRSRNAEGAEGSDFARSLRQQFITDAVKGKIIRTIFSFNLERTKDMYKVLDESIYRDINNQQAASLIKNIVLKRGFYQKNFGLSRELFIIPNGTSYDGRYVLVPKSGFKHVHAYTQCIFTVEEEKKCTQLIQD